MSKVVGDGVWLGTAAVCSGFAWQPLVNLWQGLEVPFNTVFAGTWVGCGLAFLGGLRIGRMIYPFVGDGNTGNLITVCAGYSLNAHVNTTTELSNSLNIFLSAEYKSSVFSCC